MTQVWINETNGHHYAVGEEGATLNGIATTGRPEWAKDAPHAVYGPLRPWAGGECPVAPSQRVRCLFRGRRPYMGEAIYADLPEKAKASMWLHAPAPGRTDPAMDIIAYQVRVA